MTENQPSCQIHAITQKFPGCMAGMVVEAGENLHDSSQKLLCGIYYDCMLTVLQCWVYQSRHGYSGCDRQLVPFLCSEYA